MRRLFEHQHAGLSGQKRQKTHKENIPLKEHFQGPLEGNFNNGRQFHQIHFKGCLYADSKGDNCVLIKDVYFLIKNVLKQDGVVADEHLLVVQRFRHVSDFFDHPMKSSDL